MGDRYFAKEKQVSIPGLGEGTVWQVVRRSNGKEVEIGPPCRTQNTANLWALALDEAYDNGFQNGLDVASDRTEGCISGGWN